MSTAVQYEFTQQQGLGSASWEYDNRHGVLLNRFIMTIQTLALPTLAFDKFLSYTPSWQEVASFGGVLAYGVIAYSLSYRYLPLFPAQKKEVQDVSGR